MKIIKGFLAFVIVAVLFAAHVLFAQPILSKDGIPFDTSPEVKEQIEQLYSTNPQDRAQAITILGSLGPKANVAVPYLVELLDDMGRLKPYGFVGTKASEALVKIGPAAVEPLINLLKTSPERTTRINIVLALGQIQDQRAIESLIGIFKDEDTVLRLYAAEAVGQIGKPAIEVLRVTVRDKDAGVRESAVIGLGYIARYGRDAAAAEYLTAALTDSDAEVRKQAALALFYVSTWYKEIPCIDALIAALADINQDVAAYAAQALGNIGDIRAIQPLIVALQYKSQTETYRMYGSDIHASVIGALTRIGKPASDALLDALADPNVNVREGAAEILGLLKEARAIERLIALLSDTNESVRNASMVALKAIGEPATWPLITALRGSDDKAQLLMTQVLVAITGEKIGPDEVKWHDWWEKKKKALKK